MKRSYYHYMMTLRGPNHLDKMALLANDLFSDIQFPKQSQDYHEISEYLELETDYVPTMDLFDQSWELYLENNR